MDHDSIDEALEAYLAGDEPTSIMSTQLLRQKLTESLVPSEIPPPPETEPASPDGFRKKRVQPPQSSSSGVRSRVSFGQYLQLDLKRRAGR